MEYICYRVVTLGTFALGIEKIEVRFIRKLRWLIESIQLHYYSSFQLIQTSKALQTALFTSTFYIATNGDKTVIYQLN